MDTKIINEIIDKYEGKESALIQILLEIQSENGWLPKEALEIVTERLKVPLNKVTNIATFHKSFSTIPEGKHEIHVCNGTSCHVRGAQRIIDTIQDITGITSGETDSAMEYSLKTTTCLGCCSAGPVMVVDGKYHGGMEPVKAEELLKKSEPEKE
jgi:NADH-quinone oxidoreductase subunit E